MGHVEESWAEAAEVLRLYPSFTISGVTRRIAAFKYPRDEKRLFDALRMAGLPE